VVFKHPGPIFSEHLEPETLTAGFDAITDVPEKIRMFGECLADQSGMVVGESTIGSLV
jgi:hypothetical protein